MKHHYDGYSHSPEGAKNEPGAQHHKGELSEVFRRFGHSLYFAGWVPNFVVGTALLLVGPGVTIMVTRNFKSVIVAGTIGATALLWMTAFLLYRAVDRPPDPPTSHTEVSKPPAITIGHLLG